MDGFYLQYITLINLIEKTKEVFARLKDVISPIFLKRWAIAQDGVLV